MTRMARLGRPAQAVAQKHEMGDGFRGVSAERDGRFKLAEKKLMAKMKFPPEFVHKVDMSKVHLEVLRPWVAKKVSSVASFDYPSIDTHARFFA
jgi:hypothetical protein